jgi:hypothetical protein
VTRIAGLPGLLPPDERIVWQGSPDARSVARRLCHVRSVAAYVAMVVPLTALVAGPAAAAPLLVGGLLVLGFLWLLARGVARTTEYTLTTRRLVIRAGLALPATLAIPLHAVAGAAVTLHRDGTGDLPLSMRAAARVPLHRVWPHARPWRWVHPQPMLRSVPGAAVLAGVLARTLKDAESQRIRGGDAPAPPRRDPARPELAPAG